MAGVRMTHDEMCQVIIIRTRSALLIVIPRLRELYKNLAISQRELDQAASDQQTAKAICGRRCQQEARLPQPPS